jgi:hypothetical protein
VPIPTEPEWITDPARWGQQLPPRRPPGPSRANQVVRRALRRLAGLLVALAAAALAAGLIGMVDPHLPDWLVLVLAVVPFIVFGGALWAWFTKVPGPPID